MRWAITIRQALILLRSTLPRPPTRTLTATKLPPRPQRSQAIMVLVLIPTQPCSALVSQQKLRDTRRPPQLIHTMHMVYTHRLLHPVPQAKVDRWSLCGVPIDPSTSSSIGGGTQKGWASLKSTQNGSEFAGTASSPARHPRTRRGDIITDDEGVLLEAAAVTESTRSAVEAAVRPPEAAGAVASLVI